MNKDLTEIAYILDRSGSMSPMQEAAVAAFNQFVKSQSEVPGHAQLSLVLFDNEYLLPYGPLSLANVPELTAATYVPRGGTALLDAIGRTIKDTNVRINKLPESERPGKVIMAIFTDGEENSSNEYTAAHLADLIQLYRTEKHWEFIFLAANQDAFSTAAGMNVDPHLSGNVNFFEGAILASSAAMSRKVRALRKQSSGNLDQQDENDLNASLDQLVQEEEHLQTSKKDFTTFSDSEL